jgi:hypothetical protein
MMKKTSRLLPQNKELGATSKFCERENVSFKYVEALAEAFEVSN